MAAVENAGRRIYFDDSGGDLPPIVLLQGFMASRTIWKWQLEAFTPHYRVITMDNRDAGESDPEPAAYAVTDMAADVVALLDHLGIKRATILGHSMGGYIALQFAVNYPERLDRLILVGTSALAGGALGRPAPTYDRSSWIEDPYERTFRRYSNMTGPSFFDTRPELLEAIAATARGNRISFEGMIRQSDSAFMSHDVRADLPHIAVPVLVIHGDVDPTLPVSAGRKIADAIPNAEFVEFAGVGHLPHLERTEEFNRVVLDFLAG
ncbi:MAG TPA: alpha/beta fold hydrolase [Nitrolancea sp.]|jgi:pimeloyl-ACP methyl ester carboxylesterase|nr:alpha/beta fold hydrolase [Nitrolancea sp.]